MRVVSLLPSATEMICAVGAGENLVAVSHECDHPAFVTRLPRVTRPKLDVRGTSAAIDADVRRLVADGLGVYDVDVTLLAALRPDVIVTQHQCDVCAVSYADVEAAVRATLGPTAAIVSLAPRTLTDVWDEVRRVAAVLERADAGRNVAAMLESRMRTLAARTRDEERPIVACIEWIEPLMLAGNWTAELVGIAGGRYPFADVGGESGRVDWSTLAASDPDVVVVAPCGFPLLQTRDELHRLRARQEWRALRAVAQGRARAVDGNAYLNRPGPRLVESAEILAALLHPELCGALMVRDAAEPIAP